MYSSQTLCHQRLIQLSLSNVDVINVSFEQLMILCRTESLGKRLLTLTQAGTIPLLTTISCLSVPLPLCDTLVCI